MANRFEARWVYRFNWEVDSSHRVLRAVKYINFVLNIPNVRAFNQVSVLEGKRMLLVYAAKKHDLQRAVKAYLREFVSRLDYSYHLGLIEKEPEPFSWIQANRQEVKLVPTQSLQFSTDDLPSSFWVVIQPNSSSELGDICFECTWEDFALQVRGGLNLKSIVGIYRAKSKALALARRLLVEC